MELLVWLDSWVGTGSRTAICQLRNSCRSCCWIHQVYFATSKKVNYSIYTIVRTVFSSYPETLDFPLLARLPWSLETIILRLVIKNCPNYWYTNSSNLRDLGKIKAIALFSGDYPKINNTVYCWIKSFRAVIFVVKFSGLSPAILTRKLQLLFSVSASSDTICQLFLWQELTTL